MIKKIFTFSLATTCIIFFSFVQNDDDPKKHINPYSVTSIDSKKMDANFISTWYRTNGSFNRHPLTGNAGFEWPKGSGKTARYASGLWLGCVSGNDTLTAVAEYAYDYSPGFVNDSGNAQSDSTYRIYRIVKDSVTTSDYLHWPINQGAYVTEDGKPYLMGIQTMFFVYTDPYPHASQTTSTLSLKAQILQTNWAYDPYAASNVPKSLPLSNTIFTEYRIINRRNEQWTNMWMGIWTDDDLGEATDDKIGCDTNLNLGFTYNTTNYDNIYGTAPPAVGIKFLRGGLLHTNNPNDTIKYYSPFGSDNLITKIGYKDLGLTVNNYYNSGGGEPNDPRNNEEVFRVIKGLYSDGTQWTNPITGMTTKKVFSGDPVTGTGWNMAGGQDRRSIQCTGPVTVNAGDTISIVIAQEIARGTSNLNSITELRRTSSVVQAFFNNNGKSINPPPSPKVSSQAPGSGKIYLSWDDSTEKISFRNPLSGGTYRFEGYNIYQVKSFSGNPSGSDTVLIKTFDIQNGITDILDSVYVSNYEGFVYGIVQRGGDSGISRFIILDKDKFTNSGFINGTEYKFVVTAYYYDPIGGYFTYPKVNESPKSASLKKIVPQSLTPGTQTSFNVGDTIYTDQRDLAVMPIVLKPFELVNASYTSTFGSTGSDTVWTLTKTVNGINSVLFQNIKEFSGMQDTSKFIDGFILVHQIIKDSGIVKDPHDPGEPITPPNSSTYSNRKAWTYEPPNNQWFQGPDTTAIQTAYVFGGKQFQSRSIGMSFPTSRTFRNSKTKIFANANFLWRETGTNPTLTGGPLRKIKIVFGQKQKAYRYAPSVNALQTDTALNNTPYRNMSDIPFSVYSADELDSTGGALRQLNVAFVDADNDSLWNPDTTALGKYQITYILASSYDSIPSSVYTTKNIGTANPSGGFQTFDIMYAWVPRVINRNGVPAAFTNGDVLTVTPYRPTRANFVPGYPVKYSWTVTSAEIGNKQIASSQINLINVFPNPYYGISELEYTSDGEKFIYFSHLPSVCTIYIYTLDGVPVKKMQRNNSDPNNTLEKWDLKNQSGSFVASGMYIVYVDCNELGTKTLKMAVFTR